MYDYDIECTDLLLNLSKLAAGKDELSIYAADAVLKIEYLYKCVALLENIIEGLERQLDGPEGHRTKVKQLREALEPFASLFLYPDDVGDSSQLIREDPDWNEEDNDGSSDDLFVKRGWIRLARKALDNSL